jgi:hypothetical protein
MLEKFEISTGQEGLHISTIKLYKLKKINVIFDSDNILLILIIFLHF